jgi:hypothetical protein
MKNLFTSTLSDGPVNGPQQFISRRLVLKGLGVLTAVCAFRPQLLLADQFSGLYGWRQLLGEFVTQVCPAPTASRFQSLILNAQAYSAPVATDFHHYYSQPIILDLRISPQLTVNGGRYFEFDRYPFYDSNQPCRRTKDVNDIELRRFLNAGEVEFYGGVVSPCSERRLATQCDLNDFQRTAQYYRTDPAGWEPLYVRNVTDGRRSYLAHAAKPRVGNRQALKQVFLSPNSL